MVIPGGKVNTTTKQNKQKADVVRRISRTTMGGWDGLLSLTAAYFVVLL